MILDRMIGDEEGILDFSIAFPFQNEPEDFLFSSGNIILFVDCFQNSSLFHQLQHAFSILEEIEFDPEEGDDAEVYKRHYG